MADASSVTVQVLRANQEFYDAFSAGSGAAMRALWARETTISCVHPGLPPLIGREAVLRSFDEVLGQGPRFQLNCIEPQVTLLADCALVTCFEAAGTEIAHLAATNVFVREEEEWRMVHHHAGPLSKPHTPLGFVN
jgi:ketosteroid isomerase-like protein